MRERDRVIKRSARRENDEHPRVSENMGHESRVINSCSPNFEISISNNREIT